MTNKHAKFCLAAALAIFVLGVYTAGESRAQALDNMAERARRARSTVAKTQIESFKMAIDIFEVDTGRYPKTLDELVNAPKDIGNWHGPYIEKIPLDPWERPYIYVYPAKQKEKNFDLTSYGVDGKEGGGDDITN